jgi:hypothetical protein
MDRAPDEIFGLIFEYCPTGPFPKLDPITKPEEIAILNISRKWRQIALSTPSLWSRIHFSTTPYPPVDIVSKYLALSGSCPLDIRVALKDEQCTGINLAHSLPEPEISSIRLVMDHMHRCREAHWHLYWSNLPADQIFNLAQNLVVLHICCAAELEEPLAINLVLALPKLETLRISGGNGFNIPPLTAPRLENLTFDHIMTESVERVHNVVASVAKTLKVLQFQNTWIGEAAETVDFSRLPHIELPAIEQMIVHSKHGSAAIHAYFGYPVSIIQQIGHTFHLEYGCALSPYAKRIQSAFVDRLALISGLWPFEARHGAHLLLDDALEDSGYISDFFKGLPGLVALRLRGFNPGVASRLSHLFRETRLAMDDSKLQIIIESEETGIEYA